MFFERGSITALRFLLAGQVQQGPVTVQLSLLKVLNSNNFKPLQLANKAQGVL